MLKVLAKESVLYGFGKVVSIGLSLATLPYFTRVFTINEYGLIALIISFASAMSIFMTMSLESAYTRYFNDDRYKPAEVFSAIYWFESFFGLVISVLGIGIFIIFSDFFPGNDIFPVIVVAIIAAYLRNISGLFVLSARMNRRVKSFLIIDIVGSASGILLNVILVMQYKSIIFYFVGTIAGQILSIVLAYWLLGERPFANFQGWLERIKPLLRFSIPLVPAGLAQLINTNADRWVINYYFGAGDVAIYSVGYQVASGMTFIVTVIMMAFVPHAMQLIEKDSIAASEELDKVLRIYALIGFLGVVVLSFLAPHILPVIASEKYVESFQVVGILALSSVYFGYTYFSTLGSWKAEKASDYSKAIIVGVTVNVVLNFILVQLYGVIGAAVATLASMATTAFISFYLSHRRSDIAYSYIKLLAVNAVTILCIAFLIFNWRAKIFSIVEEVSYILLLSVLVTISLVDKSYVRKALRY